MKRIRSYRPSAAMMVALTALVVALGGVAYATIPDSGGVIHGCFANSNGNLRVVETPDDCRNNETALDWNQQGPPGSGGAVRLIAERTVPIGERAAVLRQGPFTVWGECRVGDGGEIIGGAVVESEAPYYLSGNPLRSGASDFIRFIGAPRQPGTIDVLVFRLAATDGTRLFLNLSGGWNVFGDTDACRFGGYVVVGTAAG
jgi:hypothetical protein